MMKKLLLIATVASFASMMSCKSKHLRGDTDAAPGLTRKPAPDIIQSRADLVTHKFTSHFLTKNLDMSDKFHATKFCSVPPFIKPAN